MSYKRVLAVGAAAAAFAVVPAAQASALDFVYNFHSYDYAAAHPSVCNHGTGSYKYFTADDRDLADNRFEAICTGHGYNEVIKNNAGSGVNYTTGNRVRVYYNSYAYMGGCWCGSTYDTFAADTSIGGSGVKKDLNNTYNQNASHHQLP